MKLNLILNSTFKLITKTIKKLGLWLIPILIIGYPIFIVITQQQQAETIVNLGFAKAGYYGMGTKNSTLVQLKQSFPDNITKPQYLYVFETNRDIKGVILDFKREAPLFNISMNTTSDINNTGLNVKGRIDFEETKKVVRQSTLEELQKNQDFDIEDKSKPAKGFDLDDDYFDGIKYNKDDDREKGKLLKDYILVNPNIKLKSWDDFEIRGDLTTTGVATNKQLSEAQTLLFDPEYPNCKFISVAFQGGFSDKVVDTSILRKIFVIKKDRTIIEIPIVDGKFDWKSVDGELKK
jgi:hypothetical protein